MALYDYDPFKSSPNPNPATELGFKEGDILRVLDTSRKDGFYVGKVLLLYRSPSRNAFYTTPVSRYDAFPAVLSNRVRTSNVKSVMVISTKISQKKELFLFCLFVSCSVFLTPILVSTA